MSSEQSTDFQGGLHERLLREIGAQLGIVTYSNFVHGRRENYFVVSIESATARVRAYIYFDAAGLEIGDEWRSYEEWDYASIDEMNSQFLADIKEGLERSDSVS